MKKLFFSVVLLALGVVMAGRARAAEQAATAQGKAGDLDFDLFADKPKGQTGPSASPLNEQAQRALSPEAIDRKVKTRRRMLLAHQAIGFITLGALAATLIVGQFNYQDKYVTGAYTGRFETPHLGLSVTTTGLFTTTGLLALFAPNPYPKRLRLDSAMVHRVSMALATAGMVTQLILGPLTALRPGRQDQANLALGHLVTGYATFGFMATGVVAYFF